MGTFEEHILNIFNRKLAEENIRGVFYMVKSYSRGFFSIQKKFKVMLCFTNSKDIIEIKRIEKIITIKEGEARVGYDDIFEDLLYQLVFTDGIWNLISTKLP